MNTTTFTPISAFKSKVAIGSAELAGDLVTGPRLDTGRIVTRATAATPPVEGRAFSSEFDESFA